MYRILVIEDEPKTAASLQIGLTEQGYEVITAPNGKVAMTLLTEAPVHLIICDVLMPEVNGINFCRQIRKQQIQIPILFLSALGQVEDKLRGFDAGGDDYLPKPFDFGELMMRAKALLKRRQPGEATDSEVLVYADLEINMQSKSATRSGKKLSLTAKEFALLLYFVQHREKYITREELAREVWKVDFNTGTNFVEVYVSYIRNKVDKDFDVKLIHSRKGFGYLFKAGSIDENQN